MTEVSIMRIDRKSSIETEPRTLNFRQFQSARDAALYVVKTMTREEASQIFTEGMVPMASARSSNTSATSDYFDEDGEDGDKSDHQQRYELKEMRKTVTAPF